MGIFQTGDFNESDEKWQKNVYLNDDNFFVNIKAFKNLTC